MADVSLIDMLLGEMNGSLPWAVVVSRLLGGAILSGLIGFERERRNRPAGLRTHMLVCVAAVCYCLITLEMIALSFDDDVRMDPIRLIEAVTGGVAFLAAGMIVFSQGKVQGLTTGASLWLSASIGLAVGLGLWFIAMMATLLGLIIIRLLKTAEKTLGLEEE